MSDSRPLTFKSVDAKKENPQNKPGNFTVKFTPELFLEENKTHLMALDHLSMTASWHNIRPDYENNKLVISKDGGNTWETISFPAGILVIATSMNLFTKQLEKLGMILEFLFYSTGPLTKFSSNWQMDFRLISHNLGISMFCWGLKRKLFLPVNMITEVTFWFVDDEDREVNLNDIDISLTVVIKTKNGN